MNGIGLFLNTLINPTKQIKKREKRVETRRVSGNSGSTGKGNGTNIKTVDSLKKASGPGCNAGG